MAAQGKKHDAYDKRRESYRKPVTLFFSVGCILSLIYLYFSGLSIIISASFAIAVLVVTGIVIATANGLSGSYGIYIIGGRKGIGIIERLSRQRHTYWEELAVWGMILSFGIFSLFIFKKRIRMRSALFGFASLLFVLLIILPNLFLALGTINIPGISLGTPTPSSLITAYPSTFFGYVLYVLGFIGGFSAFILVMLLYGSAKILYSVAIALVSIVSRHPNLAPLYSQIPGVAPVIPGLTIPLLSGILSLAIILIFHEFSHGVLARRAGIKIKKIGLVLFGIIPIGAFVEPNEKKIKKLPKDLQDDISIAGISANFVLMVIFFIFTAAFFVYIMPYFFRNAFIVANTVPGYPAYNVVPKGAIILKLNNISVTNITTLLNADNKTPYSNVSLLTNKGYFSFKTNSSGMAGFEIAEKSISLRGGPIAGAVSFLYTFFALSFLLNFLVATVNLLAIPSLDGWRIYKNRISSNTLLKAISIFTIALLVVQALPWIWTR